MKIKHIYAETGKEILTSLYDATGFYSESKYQHFLDRLWSTDDIKELNSLMFGVGYSYRRTENSTRVYSKEDYSTGNVDVIKIVVE